ncbi:MAG TPA: hypothetical protein VFI47_30535 [Acidimicrobiales bacterium]|nr:hypothetical protein [Acidimicrobiales bacterium]
MPDPVPDPAPGAASPGPGRAARVRAALDDALWGPETGARLWVVHVGLSVLIGVRIVAGSYRQLAGTPAPLVDPVPFLGWLDRMPSAEVFVALQVIGGLAALAAALRRRPRLAFAVAWVCYLVLAGLRGSRGKVLHNDLLLLWASAPFLLAPVVVDRHDPVPRRRYGWPIRVAIVIVALVYFFAGYHKLRRSGPSWAYGDNMRYVALWGPSIGASGWSGLARWVGEHVWVARASGVFILGLELAYPVAVFVRWTRVWFALAAVFLHAMTWFLLGLDYWAWALTVPLVLIDWPAALARLRARRGRAGATSPEAVGS